MRGECSPALVLAGVTQGRVAGGGAALLPPPAMHGAVMSLVCGELTLGHTQLPVHTHHLTRGLEWKCQKTNRSKQKKILWGAAVGKDLGDSVAFSWSGCLKEVEDPLRSPRTPTPEI